MFLGVAASDFTPVAQASEVHGVAWRALVDMKNDPVPRNRKLLSKLTQVLANYTSTSTSPLGA